MLRKSSSSVFLRMLLDGQQSPSFFKMMGRGSDIDGVSRMDFDEEIRYKKGMKIYGPGAILFCLLFSAVAKPGEPYVLTGREKSIFGIYQADMKAFPELYAGENVNEYYMEFKALNNLGERKLQRGEELLFPHTEKSQMILDQKTEEANRWAGEVAAENTRLHAEEPPDDSEELSLFGSDTRARPPRRSAAEEKAREESRQKDARKLAVNYFQHQSLLKWLETQSDAVDVAGGLDGLIEIARGTVDAAFAEALVLHAYPDKNIHILAFEEPDLVGEYFFVALKKEENGPRTFYALEKGLRFFGTGDEAILNELGTDGYVNNLGGRTYTDLLSFVQEIEVGPSGSEALNP